MGDGRRAGLPPAGRSHPGLVTFILVGIAIGVMLALVAW